MASNEDRAKQISEIFLKHCKEKNYHHKVGQIANAIRVEISNLKDRSPVDVFYTGAINVGGSSSDLKNELQAIKKQFEENPNAFIVPQNLSKPTATRYDILSEELRIKLKAALQGLDLKVVVEEKPDGKSEYRMRLAINGMAINITQFKNGTLWLQGKSDSLFDLSCSEIEKIAKPAGIEVTARFISSDEKALAQFMKLNTPQLLVDAEIEVKSKVGAAYAFLTEYDQKWLLASEALCLSQIPMPEYSPYVMPAAKAFEGFCKKILIAIGLFEPNHFDVKEAKFSNLSDRNNPRRIAVCAKERHVEAFLKRISVQLDISRNFMMHSDGSVVTKVNSVEEARKKIDRIYSEVAETFNYFREIFSL